MTTIRKNSKLVKEILANDNLKVESYSDYPITMATLRREFEQFNSFVKIQEYSEGKVMFHFHSNCYYVVTL